MWKMQNALQARAVRMTKLKTEKYGVITVWMTAWIHWNFAFREYQIQLYANTYIIKHTEVVRAILGMGGYKSVQAVKGPQITINLFNDHRRP